MIKKNSFLLNKSLTIEDLLVQLNLHQYSKKLKEMEQNLPIITKKLYNMVKLAFFMLRKGICKKKILLSLNLKMARRKITFTSKVATASNGGATRPSNLHNTPTDAPQEYYFSCNSTPLYDQNITNKKNNNFIDTASYEVVKKVMETMLSTKEGGIRQLRITDSPYPLQNEEVCDHHVDQAAEDFIKRFYSKLEEQDC